MKDLATIWGSLWRRTYSAVDVREEPPGETLNEPMRIKGVLTLASLGVMTFLFGIFILVFQPYDVLFKWKCVFSPGGEIFELWRKPPVDLHLKVYLFNVTNRDAFMEGREKLKVQEVGPYVYRELMSHENVTFNENGTVSSVPSHPLEWMPEMSGENREEDLLVLPHIALLAIAQVVSEKSYFTQFGLNLVIRQSNSLPLIEMSARDFMFGYKSPLLSLGNQFLSDWITFDKLGLIDRMYDFEGDFETFYTGERGDVSETGLLDTYRGSSQLPQWEGVCGNVQNASDGTKFRGYLKEEERLLFYRKSLCRPSALVRVNTTVASGLDGFYYTFEENSLDNGRNNSDNSCYCRNGKCPTPGIVDVTDCYYGFPIGVSFPHFLDGDESLRESVDGSDPDPAKHRSYFIVEPVSGLPLELAARYQINMVLGDLNSITNVQRFSKMVLPLLWIEIGMSSLPNHLKAKFNFYLYILPVLQTAAIYASFVAGALLVSVASYRYLHKIKAIGRFAHYRKTPWARDEEAPDRKLAIYGDLVRGGERKDCDSMLDGGA